MKVIRARDFSGTRAWEALDVAEIEGATVRLHWTDRPYRWHVNDGDEVFAVVDGAVDMHVRAGGRETVHRLETGDIFHAEAGDEHVAYPVGAARILVVERKDST